MSDKYTAVRPLRTDPRAESASPNEPAFIAKPKGAPTYHGFPILEESLTDGWLLGVISDPNDPNGCESLDGFVVAPDDSRAGLVWDCGVKAIEPILEPDADRWGVYSVPLSKPIRNDAELIKEFRRILPMLMRLKAAAN